MPTINLSTVKDWALSSIYLPCGATIWHNSHHGSKETLTFLPATQNISLSAISLSYYVLSYVFLTLRNSSEL